MSVCVFLTMAFKTLIILYGLVKTSKVYQTEINTSPVERKFSLLVNSKRFVLCVRKKIYS